MKTVNTIAHFKEKKTARLAKNQFESEILKELRQLRRDMLFVKTAIDVRDECFYPPEERLSKEFVKEAEEADKRIKAGMGKAYTPEEFKAKFS